MENKLQELYNKMDDLRTAWEQENRKNPRSFDKLLEIQREINGTYEEIKKIEK